MRFLANDELAALLEACRNSSCGYLYPAVMLALTTGMRRGEQLNLTWENVDFGRGWITLGITKNMQRRGVPLKVIGQLLGHRTSAMPDRYSHLADQVVADAVSKVMMTKLFGGLDSEDQVFIGKPGLFPPFR